MAVPYFLQIAGIIYVCFVYFAAIAQLWINLHRQNVFYTVILWKGSQVPQEEDEEAVTKKAIKELEIFVAQIFYRFFPFISFFQLLYFITFFLYFFLPPTFIHTHDPRPLTLFKNMRILKFKSQLTITIFAAVNYLNEPLRKQNFILTGSKGHGLWFVIGGFQSVLCVSVFQGSLLVIVIMIDGSEKRDCEGGFWNFRVRIFGKSAVRQEKTWKDSKRRFSISPPYSWVLCSMDCLQLPFIRVEEAVSWTQR